MVKIRLKRIGKRKEAFYRIVAADARTAVSKKYIELLGTYNPQTKDVKLNNEQTLNWLRKGAQPTETARKLLSSQGVFKILHAEKYGHKQVKPVTD